MVDISSDSVLSSDVASCTFDQLVIPVDRRAPQIESLGSVSASSMVSSMVMPAHQVGVISNPANSTLFSAKWNFLGVSVMPFLPHRSSHSDAR